MITFLIVQLNYNGGIVNNKKSLTPFSLLNIFYSTNYDPYSILLNFYLDQLKIRARGKLFFSYINSPYIFAHLDS